MPNFENLKKTAKLYLWWHREKHVPVAAEIRRWLPGFADLSDQAILDHRLKLADMHQLVAMKQGFETWQALKEGLPSPNQLAERRPSLAVPWVAEPQLLVRDIGMSCDFYTTRLGFGISFIYGEPAFYAQVQRDGARLNLRRVREEVFNTSILEKDVLSATITLDDIKTLFLEYRAAGAPFHQSLRTEPWGARSFIVRDPDGNLIAFAG